MVLRAIEEIRISLLNMLNLSSTSFMFAINLSHEVQPIDALG